MLTSVARTAAEARAQQQERIDELDTELRRLRESTEKELTDIKIRLRREGGGWWRDGGQRKTGEEVWDYMPGE